VNAIKELNVEIETLKNNTIKDLNTKIEILENKVKDLES
jgi:polyhydroxyalkanoate synthesis regulator phasin